MAVAKKSVPFQLTRKMVWEAEEAWIEWWQEDRSPDDYDWDDQPTASQIADDIGAKYPESCISSYSREDVAAIEAMLHPPAPAPLPPRLPPPPTPQPASYGAKLFVSQYFALPGFLRKAVR